MSLEKLISAIESLEKTIRNINLGDIPNVPSPREALIYSKPNANVKAGAPFSSEKGLLDYAIFTHNKLGRDKSHLVQEVLLSMDYKSVREIKKEDYGKFYSKIESLLNNTEE